MLRRFDAASALAEIGVTMSSELDSAQQRATALESRKAQLRTRVAEHAGLSSVVVFGSSTEAAKPRRDQWSDLDANIFITPDQAGSAAKQDWDFLPDPSEIVLRAREGENGGVVLWRDGMICEFGVGSPWPIQDEAREVLVDGGDLDLRPGPELPNPADQFGLFLAKLLIGYGRIMRGELLAGNAVLRTYAVTALAESLRQVLVPDAPRSLFDPLRRLEQSLPEAAAQIAALQLAPASQCALGLLDMAKEHLGAWPDFPSEAWAVVRAEVTESES